MNLTAEQQLSALRDIAAWRLSGTAPRCPSCSAPGLAIVDCSARPHAEWYKLTCAACGLDTMLGVPMATPGSFGD